MSEQKIDKNRRQEIVLAILYLFSQHRRKKENSQYDRDKEVSHSELIDCLREVQKEFPLGYEFPEKLPYVCHELSEDLDDLWLHQGYIKRWTYKQRGAPLFPTNFVALKSLGRGHAKNIPLSFKLIEVLNKAIELAIEKYQKTWGPYAR